MRFVGVNSSNDTERRKIDGCAGVATIYCVNRRSDLDLYARGEARNLE
jgi:hypothetical protein